MKNILCIAALLAFGLTSAQTDPVPKDKTAIPTPHNDSLSVNRQIQKEPDLKTMDAVKTQDHPKPVPKKQPAAAQDSTMTKRKKSGK